MNRKPLISVIVPVYNVEEYLPRCVDSILAQSYDHLEVILVDDGAKDGSGAICDGYAAKDPRVRVIHQENGGLSSARNAGIQEARGDYLAFVDSDDWIEPDAYAHMLDRMERYGAKLVCGGRYDVDSATGERTLGLCPRKEEVISAEEMVGRIFLWDGCDSSACDKLYHRSLLETFRYPHGKVCEDVPVTYRIVLYAERVVLCPVPVYNYYHRPQSISTSAVSEKTFHFAQHTAEILPYIRQHHPGIAPQAEFLRVRSLTHPLLLLAQAPAQIRKTYQSQYRSLKKELWRHLPFVLKNPWFGAKERITDLLLMLGLYRLLRPVFHRT